MASWRELARERIGAETCAPDVPGIEGVPADLAAHLLRLDRLNPPRAFARAVWSMVVADALALARGGWVQSALALGWTEADLFGIGPRDANDFCGLAVWLQGRQLVALDANTAIAATASGRACFNRGGFGHGKDATAAPVPLWRFARG